MGDPLQAETSLGPMAQAKALGFLQAQVDEAMSLGAECLLGGKQEAPFFQPSLLVKVPNHAQVMQEESFGPLLPVAVVKDDAQALALMQDTRFGLTASVWSKDQQRAAWFAKDLRAGVIFQNRCDYIDPALPWSGYGDSGKGCSLSKYGFYNLTRTRGIHFRL